MLRTLRPRARQTSWHGVCSPKRSQGYYGDFHSSNFLFTATKEMNPWADRSSIPSGNIPKRNGTVPTDSCLIGSVKARPRPRLYRILHVGRRLELPDLPQTSPGSLCSSSSTTLPRLAFHELPSSYSAMSRIDRYAWSSLCTSCPNRATGSIYPADGQRGMIPYQASNSLPNRLGTAQLELYSGNWRPCIYSKYCASVRRSVSSL